MAKIFQFLQFEKTGTPLVRILKKGKKAGRKTSFTRFIHGTAIQKR